jgi:hypothetical protein
MKLDLTTETPATLISSMELKLATEKANGNRPRVVNTVELAATNRGEVARDIKSVAVICSPNPATLVLFILIKVVPEAPRIRQLNEANDMENCSTEHLQVADVSQVTIRFEDDTISPMLTTATETEYSLSS